MRSTLPTGSLFGPLAFVMVMTSTPSLTNHVPRYSDLLQIGEKCPSDAMAMPPREAPVSFHVPKTCWLSFASRPSQPINSKHSKINSGAIFTTLGAARRPGREPPPPRDMDRAAKLPASPADGGSGDWQGEFSSGPKVGPQIPIPVKVLANPSASGGSFVITIILVQAVNLSIGHFVHPGNAHVCYIPSESGRPKENGRICVGTFRSSHAHST